MARMLPPFRQARDAFPDGTDDPRGYLERCIEAIEERDPTTRAVVALALDDARRAADPAALRYRAGRPLWLVDGAPIGVKDVIETADLPTTMNSALYAGHAR